MKTIRRAKRAASVWVVFVGLSCPVGMITGMARAADEPRGLSEKTPVSLLSAGDQAGSKRYSRRRVHDPNGIGKFYMGREIAHVMGFGFEGRGARWLERAERETEERTSLLIKSLGLKPGMVVADIGAGSGVISLKMAERVAPGGTIMAVDIQQEMLDALAKNIKRLELDNVKPVKGTVKSPNLKPTSVDLALMVDVYHEFEFPYEMTMQIARSMKPGGRVVFVEYRMEDPTVPIKKVHKMAEAQVRKEIDQPEFQLKWKQTIGVLPWQHIIIFEKFVPNEKSPSPFRGG